MGKCLNCGTDNEDDAVFCKECGVRFTPISGWTRLPVSKNCTSCGLQIPVESKFCKFCGQDYTESMSKPSTNLKSGNRLCVECGREIDFESNYCLYCGHDYRDRNTFSNGFISKEPTVAGIIDIITGAAMIIIYFVYEFLFDKQMMIFNLEDSMIGPFLLLFPGILAIIGGAFCIMRIHWIMALIGSIAALIGFIAPGIASIILVAHSKDEFKNKNNS
jgi:RNA polymerase subunit RPABC4/transcription elongation factor Spt4